SHKAKAGTPTMGGVLIVLSIIIPTLLWADLRNPFMWIAVCATVAYGIVGFSDDYLKVVNKRNLGLTAREKIGFQVVIALMIGIVLLYLMNARQYSTKLTVPFFKSFTPDLLIDRLFPTHLFLIGYLPFLAFIALVLVGCSNAVNLTDGLDGLAIGCVLIA